MAVKKTGNPTEMGQAVQGAGAFPINHCGATMIEAREEPYLPGVAKVTRPVAVKSMETVGKAEKGKEKA